MRCVDAFLSMGFDKWFVLRDGAKKRTSEARLIIRPFLFNYDYNWVNLLSCLEHFVELAECNLLLFR